jgi:hypothetical protein
MQGRFLGALTMLVLMQFRFAGIVFAQEHARQKPCPATSVGLKREDVNSFWRDNSDLMRTSLCDGSIHVGTMTESKHDNFALETGRSKLVQVNYNSVNAVGPSQNSKPPSRAEKVFQIIDNLLLLPFRILECLLGGCGS